MDEKEAEARPVMGTIFLVLIYSCQIETEYIRYCREREILIFNTLHAMRHVARVGLVVAHAT